MKRRESSVNVTLLPGVILEGSHLDSSRAALHNPENTQLSAAHSPLRILGIDPGTAIVGYGILDYFGKGNGASAGTFEYVSSGVIRTSKEMSAGKRLQMIRADLVSLIETYTPDVLVVEAIFFFKNAKTLVPVSQARGVIIEAAASMNVDTFEYTPMQVKLNIAGHGRADKSVVQDSIARLLGLPGIIRPDDASDALAIAVCHARMSLAR